MPLSPNKRLLTAAAPRDAAPAAAQWGLATSDAPSPPPAASDDAAGPAFQVLVATPAGATLRRDVRPKERVAALFDAVAAWTRLDVADLRLVVAGVVLEGHRRVRHYRGLRRNAKVHVALRMGGETPWGPCLHQWVRAIQVNGADVPVGGGDGRYPSADAFEALTRAVVGPDGRARVVVTFHGPDRAFNRQLAWGRVEPRRGGSAVDVRVDEPLRRCFGLAVRDGRRRGFEDGAPASDFLDLRPGDATAAAVAGPPQGELDHRARAGFAFRYDYFGDCRQLTLQFAGVVPDTEYLFGLAAPGRLVHDGDAGERPGFRDGATYRVVFGASRRPPPAAAPPEEPAPVVVPAPARRRRCCAVS